MTIEEAQGVLRTVKDPEIPVIAITDLGIVADVRVRDGIVEVDLMPTFAGCPALNLIERAVETALLDAGAPEAKVAFVNSPAWTTDRLSEEGRAQLRSFGIAPPVGGSVPCPFCGSAHTRRESAFGPTLCRSVYYCDECHNPFELMKPIILEAKRA